MSYSIADITVADLADDGVEAAVEVCARAFRDSPSTVGMYGDDPVNRLVWSRRTFGALLRSVRDPTPICALVDGAVIGICAFAPPGRCLRAFVDASADAPVPADEPPESQGLRRWLFAMAEHDPPFEHIHVGPIAVDVAMQGMGIGSRMLEVMCARLDERGIAGWLETDKTQNVRLYERFGFVVKAEVDVNGQHNWFMRRG